MTTDDVDHVGAAIPLRRPGRAAALERLREMILSGELEPGSVVSQLTLSRALGVSTTPLREVVRELAAEGLMEVELNRRPRVAPLDIDDLHGVYAGRILLESLAITLTVPLMTEDDLDGLRDDLDEMHALADADDHRRWAVTHRRFHSRLIVEVPPTMAASIAALTNRAERYRRLMDQPRVGRSLHDAEREHRRITDACVAGDAGTAATELAHHLAQTALALSAAFAPAADPRPVREAVRMVSCCTAAAAVRLGRRMRRA